MVLIGVAVFFLWKGSNEAGFVSIVLGCVSLFLGIRFQAKDRVDKRMAARVERELEEETLRAEPIQDPEIEPVLEADKSNRDTSSG